MGELQRVVDMPHMLWGVSCVFTCWKEHACSSSVLKGGVVVSSYFKWNSCQDVEDTDVHVCV